MNNAAKLAAGAATVYAIAALSKPRLEHFSATEFGIFYPLMSVDLLLKLDALRARLGRPISISPAPGALARLDESESQHNLIYTLGVIRAVDVFIPGAAGGSLTAAEKTRVFSLAADVGFTGIGFYTDTDPIDMTHLDVRPGAHVATWARVAGHYVDIGQVIA